MYGPVWAALESCATCEGVMALVNKATSHTSPANCWPRPAGLFVYCGSLPINTSAVEPTPMPLVLTVATLLSSTPSTYRRFVPETAGFEAGEYTATIWCQSPSLYTPAEVNVVPAICHSRFPVVFSHNRQELVVWPAIVWFLPSPGLPRNRAVTEKAFEPTGL